MTSDLPVPEPDDLERRLSSMTPTAPSARVWRRIERELSPLPPRLTTFRFWPLFATAGLGLACLWLATFSLFPRATKPVALWNPVDLIDVIVSETRDGEVELPDSTRAIVARRSHISAVTWVNSREQETVRWIVPREEVAVAYAETAQSSSNPTEP